MSSSSKTAAEPSEANLDALDAIMSAVADCSEDFIVSVRHDSFAGQWYITIEEHVRLDDNTRPLRKLTVPGEDLGSASASFVKALHAINPPKKFPKSTPS